MTRKTIQTMYMDRKAGLSVRFFQTSISFLGLGAAGLAIALLTGCGSSNSLVVYTSVDRDYAEPIIQAFQDQNPEMEVKPVYDSEVTKTTGLYERIIHEKRSPQADVFWNSEIIRTIQLKHKNMLDAHESASAADIPPQFKDPDHYWTGFSARARVMIINDNLVPKTETPASVPALLNQKYRGKIAMANPKFGTTAGHMAAMYTIWQPQFFNLRFSTYVNNRVVFLPGNATVRDQVAQGQIAYGLTDTDDALAALEEGKPVRMELLDQSESGMGTFLIPNSVGLIKNAPHPDQAKQFIDYLLSPEIEEQLAQSRGKQIPVRESVPGPEGLPAIDQIKVMDVDYDEIARNLEPCLDLLRNYVP